MLRQYLKFTTQRITHAPPLVHHMSTNAFDQATALEHLPNIDSNPLIAANVDRTNAFLTPQTTAFRTKQTVSPDWSISHHPNGGYTAAMCISAARNVQPYRDHLTLTCHYNASLIENEPAIFLANVLKEGQQMSTVSVGVYQQGHQKVSFTGTFGTLNKMQGVSRDSRSDGIGTPIEAMDGIEACTDTLWQGFKALNVGTLYSKGLKVHVPTNSPFIETLLAGKDQGEPRIDAYVEFLDGREPCLRSLALFNDCLPPAVLNYAGMSSWVPTIEYTLHCYRRPAPGPMKLSFRADQIVNGVATVNGEVQDSKGNLCSVSRQMCTIRV